MLVFIWFPIDDFKSRRYQFLSGMSKGSCDRGMRAYAAVEQISTRQTFKWQ